MFKNYLKIAVRNILKNKLNSLLNITGLSLGIACSLLIIFHIKEELSYDKHFPKADRIYRITSENLSEDNYRHWALVSPLHGPEIKKYISEIEQIARFSQKQSTVLCYTPEDGRPKRFIETTGFSADSTVIDMFDLQFIKGNPYTALDIINSIVLTENVAKNLFGDDDPLGKTISVENDTTIIQVTGVIEDRPFNSHLQFDYLNSMPTLYHLLNKSGMGDFLNSRGWAGMYTYILLNENSTIKQVKDKLTEFAVDFYSDFGTKEEILANNKLHLQSIKDIHLYSNLEQEMGPNSDIAYVYIFSTIALFVLMIAIVNYVNISTAQALKRMKEVGVRKLLGARKPQLIKQFLGESFLLTIAAAVVAVELYNISIPFYNNLSGKSLNFIQILTPVNIAFMLLIIVLVGTLSGLYPAFFISNFKPIESLKGIKNPKSSAAKIRKGLVIFQFVVSVFLIFSTIIIYRQMVYFRTKDLGFDKNKVIAIKLSGDLREGAVKNPKALKTELLRHSAVSSVSIVSNLPGERLSVESLRPESFPDDKELPAMRFMRVDESFLSALNIDIIEGRDFSEISPNLSAFVLNESAVKALNLKKPIGQMATTLLGNKGEIIGIVKDFHFASLHNVIEPLVLEFNTNIEFWNLITTYLLVKIQGSSIPVTLEFLGAKVKEIEPESLFIYSFLDDNLNRLYQSEDRMSNIFKAFTLFAIFISCLGLFGLSAYSAELRTKEVGVRKVLGASVSNVVLHLSKEFVILVIVANIIALPIAWYFMHTWLQDFAYRIISIGFGTFLLATALALAVALITVSYQAIKAACANPVDALKYE